MNRREFSILLSAAGAAFSTREADAAPAEEGKTPILYFADGYHGGAKGHMPAGAWRDILNTMRELRAWKLNLDIEPESWDALIHDDPDAFHELSSYLDRHGPDARVEMVGGTFTQPYGWAVNGESNVRQLVRGMAIIRQHFPGVVLETYAVQEPCWSSALPQILKSLGFTGAVLKDPGTAWGGYSAGFDADLANWVGPDGSAIPVVPRYACEELRKVYETESATGSVEFARKCVAHGIPHPAGTYLQDLGWAAKPKVAGDHIRYVTWREYIHRIANPPTKDWQFSLEDILTTLPWGEKTLQGVAQQERSAENRILVAEKMAAMAWMEKRYEWPSADLRDAWDSLMWAQGHDPWITATTRTGRQAWAFQVASGTASTESTANSIIASATRLLTDGKPSPAQQRLGPQWVRVFNTLGIERSDLVELPVATDRGTVSLRMFDAEGHEIPCQIFPVRRYPAPAASLNATMITFRPTVPAIGHATYRVEPVYDDSAKSLPGPVSAVTNNDGVVLLESDLYRIQLDPRRGGALTSLYAKAGEKEFCDPSAKRSFNEYRGYFIAQKQWHSSTDHPARISILESGPLRARVRVAGQVGDVPYQTTITLAQGQRRIDFQVRFTYEKETWIGDPWDIKPEDRRSERRRSQNDGRWKLQAFFPASLRNQAIYKNAAYDVCRSRNADTFFQGWDEIKHNIVINWVDVFDEHDKNGLAVFSDHTTAYTHGPEHPLSLVMGWGWEGGFWWGKRPLQGVQQVGYGLVPHRRAWDDAKISEEASRWNEPLIASLMDGAPENTRAQSLIAVSGSGIEIPTILVEQRHGFIRLFNAEGDAAERSVSFAMRPVRVHLVELDGRVARELAVQRGSDGRYRVKLAMPRFGIRTLRFEMDTIQHA